MMDGGGGGRLSVFFAVRFVRPFFFHSVLFLLSAQVMGAHEPNPEAKAGICYVETKSLDGETNLKIRQVAKNE